MSTANLRIGKSAVAAFIPALIMLGISQIGLAKKVMGRAAPTFVNVAKYGMARGVIVFSVGVFNGYINQKMPKNKPWPKIATIIGVLSLLYFSVPYVLSFAKNHLSAKVDRRFAYLALIVECSTFHRSLFD